MTDLRPTRSTLRAAWLCLATLTALAHAPLRARAQDPASTFTAQLGAGLGVGMRDVGLPTLEGERRIATGVFPALDIAARADNALTPHVLLGARFRYQTSLGLVAEETPYGGVRRETSMRAHHIDFGLVPALRFSPSPRGVALGLFTGWSVRAIRTVRGVSIPDFTVHGPTLRLELRVPIGDTLELRLAPEAIAWIGASGALRAAGVLEPTGFAWGGEASVRIGLSDALALELGYHASYGVIASGLGGSFTDAEHFATAQLVLLY